MMTPKEALNKLAQHDDPEVREAATALLERVKLQDNVLGLVKAALSKIRLDVKYLAFDLSCTRQERDEARTGS